MNVIRKTGFVMLMVLAGGLFSCGNESVDSDPDEIKEEVSSTLDSGVEQEGEAMVFDDLLKEIPELNEENRTVGIDLADNQIDALPKEIRAQGDGLESKFRAHAKVEKEGVTGFVLRLNTFDSEELEPYQEEDHYFFVLLDASGKANEFIQIFNDTRMMNDQLISSGWEEMDDIVIPWKILVFSNGTVLVEKDEQESFSGTEAGYDKAVKFRMSLYR